jgi:hypothetical protein
MPATDYDTTNILLSWRDLGTEWTAKGPSDLCDRIECDLDRDTAVKARANCDSFTLTIQIRTLDLMDTARWLKETGLI